MITAKDIVLRDFAAPDIEKRIYWETVETEWQRWDAPWESEGLTEAEREAELQRYVAVMRQWAARSQSLSADERRYAFQIERRDAGRSYIGWVTSYCVDDDFNFTDGAGRRAVGIDIPDREAQGNGYAYQALCAFINYLLEQGEQEIYTQTWSGNERMIHIAERLGFEECRRKAGIRLVGENRYDGLTFRLNRDKYALACSQILGEQ